mmetsp:Transcript_74686/g.175307  ORF Transcript_74686/g.175307 Transcript_74686/m.175307 type:complete len:229 (+) Transcript_74686:193-879(+)
MVSTRMGIGLGHRTRTGRRTECARRSTPVKSSNPKCNQPPSCPRLSTTSSVFVVRSLANPATSGSDVPIFPRTTGSACRRAGRRTGMLRSVSRESTHSSSKCPTPTSADPFVEAVRPRASSPTLRIGYSVCRLCGTILSPQPASLSPTPPTMATSPPSRSSSTPPPSPTVASTRTTSLPRRPRRRSATSCSPRAQSAARPPSRRCGTSSQETWGAAPKPSPLTRSGGK